MFLTRTLLHADGVTPLHYTDSISLLVLSHMSSERIIEAVFTTCCTPQSMPISILTSGLTFS